MNKDDGGMYGEAASRATGAQSKLVSARDKLADGIQVTADTLGERADNDAGERVAELERAAADKLQSWSEGLREWDVEAAEARVRETVMRRPGVSLLVAAGVGLCIGLWIRKS